jgi:hypothetical protein
MSPSRKSRTPDKKADTEHKPSRKVALEEVLRSLQDLVQNELSVEGKKPRPEPAAPPARAAKPEIPVPPVADEPTPETAMYDGQEEEAITLEGIPENPAAATAAPAVEQAAVPPEGLQQPLPFLDPVPKPAIAAATAAYSIEMETETATTPDALSRADEIADADTSEIPGIDFEPSAPAVNTHPVEDDGHNDIPVLDDAVDFVEEIELHAPETPASTNAPAMPPAIPDIRRLAIQVAARLNVELRKQGRPSLSSDVITRLAHLLEEALAKAAANVENSRPEKH